MEDMGGPVRAMVYSLLFGLPAIFIAASLFVIWRAGRFARGATPVRAIVVSQGRRVTTDESGSAVVYSPTFAYRDAKGLAQASVTGASSGWGFDLGTEVEILVNPAFPGVGRIKSEWPYFFGAIFLVVGIVFGVAGYAAFRALQ
ncbi:MAG: DUF3592 domain-containing protein [Paracoccaceae bacterium]|jgi:hypothetical protein